ncbi:class I SAM-dependent methyltransferase [Mycobacterium seoulense]|uniref:class I SAM-dependent methyltransferase n=1 Tax=Mycobacterium seoulense TaxID=386911 RepID=UPI001E38E0F8|nr:class I SAM-dependent methyltransferase [Mycobacterium seoulense]
MNRFPMLRSGIWRRHPSLLWHYPTTYVRHLRTVTSAAAIRAEYEKAAADGQFAEHWFDVNIIPWCAALTRVFARTDPLDVLEVGSWEGRSTLFLATYFPHARLTAVDTWEGSHESISATTDVQGLEARFDHNLSACAARVTKRKGMSSTVLPQLLAEGRRYDLIYVDGSHYAPDVLVDAVLAWRLLNQGGVMIFDDFLWRFYSRKHANPDWGISHFLKFHAREYRVLGAYYQLILQKTVAHTDQVA